MVRRRPASRCTACPAHSASTSAVGPRNFWLSRSRPPPGRWTTTAVTAERSSGRLAAAATAKPPAPPAIRPRPPGPAALASGRSPSPTATAAASRAAAASSAEPRSAGHTARFQLPPRVARLPSVPNRVSARAANALTPAGSVGTPPTRATDGSSQGRFTTAANARTATARRTPARLGATVIATAVPVAISADVLPASAAAASHSSSGGSPPPCRYRSAAPATHGSTAYPIRNGQCPISRRSAVYGFQV